MRISLILLLLLVAASPARGEDAAFTQVKEVMKTVEKAVNDGDMVSLERLFDFDAILDRAIGGDHLPAKQEWLFRTRMKSSVALSQGVVGGVKNHGSYRLLKVERGSVPGTFKAWFRLATPGGINYHVYDLATAGEHTRIVDLLIFSLGEPISQTFRRAYLPLFYETEHLQDLQPEDRAYLEHVGPVARIGKFVQAGDGQAALKVYYSLPRVLRETKQLGVLRLTAAEVADDWEEFELAVESLNELFPQDPTNAFLIIDAFLSFGENEAALKAIDQVEQAVGEDAYLNAWRASAYLAQEDLEKAKSAAQQAHQAEPNQVMPLFLFVYVSLEEKDFEETVRLLTKLREELQYPLPDLKSLEVYHDFLQSQAYDQWSSKSKE